MKRPTRNYAAAKNLIILPIVAVLLVMCTEKTEELIPGYYSGTSGYEKFITIRNSKDYDLPKPELSKYHDKDLEILKIRSDNANNYLFEAFVTNNNTLKGQKDFVYGPTIQEFNKGSYKWENDSTLKITLINSSDKSTASFRIWYDKNKVGTKIATIGMHFENK